MANEGEKSMEKKLGGNGMKELITKLVDQAGVSEGVAEKVIAVVKDFLEDKLPSPIAGQVSKVLGGIDDDKKDGMMDRAKGLFGK